MIFLSSGHTAQNQGAYNGDFGLFEHIETAKIMDFICGLDKKSDTFIRVPVLSIVDKVKYINERSSDPEKDVAIDLHLDSGPAGKKSSGYTLFHYPTSVNGKLLANSLDSVMISTTPLNCRGVKPAGDLYFITATKMPAILFELLFLSNRDDIALLFHARSVEYFAGIILKGVLLYYNRLLQQSEKEVMELIRTNNPEPITQN